jgi:hypothetical protein
MFSALATFVATTALVLVLVPAFASAQTNNCGTSNNTWGWNNTTTNCTPGNLLVYVQVLNNANNGVNKVASDFTVTVSSTNSAPTSVVGSLSGTSVLVSGSYTVQAAAIPGYVASYSAGCTGLVINNQQASCIVTENNSNLYSNYPSSYYPNQYYQNNGTYGYNYSAPLSCSPSNQTVSIGQSVTFYAQGGDVSQFNWYNSVTPNNKSYNIGRSYTTTLQSPGQQSITVTNGQQYATCNINVVGFPIVGYPTQPGYGYNNGITYGNTPDVMITPTYIPRLPNTGFGPVNGGALAFVLAFLIAATIAAYPYVRQAFAIVLR